MKLGTAFIGSIHIPAETARCPLCGPDPAFIVIDAQSLGCTDLDDTHPLRPAEYCPVLDIPASKMCVVEHAPLRDAVAKVLKTSTPLTANQETLMRAWAATRYESGRPTPSSTAARVFFRFFPVGSNTAPQAPGAAGASPAARAAGAGTSATTEEAAAVDGEPPRRQLGVAVDSSAEAALRSDGAGGVVLGGKGAPAKKPSETWRDRTGLCRPDFTRYPREDDGIWICVRPFLQSLMTETACLRVLTSAPSGSWPTRCVSSRAARGAP